MAFSWPNVGARCLLCGRARCARWKGYFVRWLICGDFARDGPVAIHVGHCRSRKEDFSYMPDFLFHGVSSRAQV